MSRRLAPWCHAVLGGWAWVLLALLACGNVSSRTAVPSGFVNLIRRSACRQNMYPVHHMSALRMRMEVDVKERPITSAPNAPLTRTKSAAITLPPVPKDNFRHVSLAGADKDCGPFVKVGKFKLNLYGAWFMFAAIALAIPWGFLLAWQYATIKLMDKIDPARRWVDVPCRAWAKGICVLGLSMPEVTGTENIPDGPAVFVANHASWMDVPYVSMLPQDSKYFAKADLLKVPVLGQSMRLSGHVMVDRDDKRSQLESMVRARHILSSGRPLFVFPEGTRGKDGRLGDFKLGAFRLATKLNVPIVPVSISGTHLVMPTSVLMPQRSGNGISAVHVHPPIPVDGRTDAQLAAAAFEVINDALPEQQKYIAPQATEESA